MGSHKTHDAFTVAPALRHRPSDAIDVRDDRPAGSPPLIVDADALDAALSAAGVTVRPDTEIRLRLRPQTTPGQHGSTQQIGPDAYRIIIHIAAKPVLADRHLYVVNNSLLCRGLHNRDYADLRIMPMRTRKALPAAGSAATRSA